MLTAPAAHSVTLLAPVLGALSRMEQRALYRLVVIMAYGEQIALDGARAQARACTNPDARRTLRRQARHERFHLLVFNAAAATLRHLAGPHPATTIPAALQRWHRTIMRTADNGRLAESLLVQQVFLEGLGHVLLRGIDQACEPSGPRLTRLRQTIIRQEAEHHTQGIALLTQELQQAARRTAASYWSDRVSQLRADTGAILHNLQPQLRTLDVDKTDYAADLDRALIDVLPEGWVKVAPSARTERTSAAGN